MPHGRSGELAFICSAVQLADFPQFSQFVTAVKSTAPPPGRRRTPPAAPSVKLLGLEPDSTSSQSSVSPRSRAASGSARPETESALSSRRRGYFGMSTVSMT